MAPAKKAGKKPAPKQNNKKNPFTLEEAAAHAEKVTARMHAAIMKSLPKGSALMMDSAPAGGGQVAGGGPGDPWEPKVYVTISAVYQVYPPKK
jgi:hypothetical protein